MERTEIKTALEKGKPGDEVTIAGWIKSVRESKSVGFIHLNDGSTFDSVQILVPAEFPGRQKILKQITGACLAVKGKLIASQGKGQTLELEPASIKVLGECDPSSPVQKAGTSFEFLRGAAHMRPRTNTFGAVFRVRAELSFAVHEFFRDRGFVMCHSPILTTSDCEGAGAMFQVSALDLENPPRGSDGKIDWSQDFFGEKCGLTVSGQLEAEILAMSLSKVYTFGPTFRAEQSTTPRHAAEFWMIEPEFAFADLKDDRALAEAFIKHLIKHLFKNCGRDLAFFDERVEKGLRAKLEAVAEADFGVITYTQAVEVLEKSGRKWDHPIFWGKDLQTEHERYLTEEYAKRPLFVIDYPRGFKPFYMYCNDDRKTVACMDLLVPRVGEIIGGSQREHRLDRLLARMKETGVSPETYSWYADLRRFGTAPHAGFGLGFERMLMYVTGMENIRDVELCPRVPGCAKF
ncbi:MAG TPA: asparagine--tRNA ligase [Elusimicrobia bacterium]|nr:MAG: asparagine--tRNA ligase [Elusimicrobia bacterium GWA2_66_18]HBL17664.1 asparagine--tRNA ligase [Elusimicrobiota bacterium]